MKKLFALLVLSGIATVTQAQWINSITVQPANPTTNDIIKVITNVDYSSGGCDEKVQSSSVVGNHLYGESTHCLGPLAFICNSSDTFDFGTLPAGAYTFVYQANSGQGPAPCTPGINPGPTDSITFIVQLATGLQPIDAASFQIIANASSDYIKVRFKEQPVTGTVIEIFDLTGRKVVATNANMKDMTIAMSGYETGAYLLKLRIPGHQPAVRKFIYYR